MDIEEVRKRKSLLESEICELIREYEKVTESYVTHLDLTRLDFNHGRSVLFSVKADVIL